MLAPSCSENSYRGYCAKGTFVFYTLEQAVNRLKNGHFPAVLLSQNNCLSFRPEQVFMLIGCVTRPQLGKSPTGGRDFAAL